MKLKEGLCGIRTPYIKGFDCWSFKSCRAIVSMPATANNNKQDIRETLIDPNLFAKYILTLKNDPRRRSGDPRSPEEKCKFII